MSEPQQYPWHVDENGAFHWGTPADRSRLIVEGMAPPPPEMTQETQQGEPEAPAPDRGRER